MFIYVGKTFTSVATGRRIVKVGCDRCACEFFYELSRQGVGVASAPYYIGQQRAERRAKKAAEKKLSRRLARESELVPCPKCHWINEQLVSGFRQTRFRGWLIAAFIIALVVWLGFMIAALDINESPHNGTGASYLNFAIYGTIGAAVSFAAGLFAQRLLRRAFVRPNRKFPAPPELPVGTPKAWTEAEMNTPAEPLTNRFVPEAGINALPGWAVVRAGHLVIPRKCCECLAPAETLYREAFRVNNRNSGISAPLCIACASRLRTQWWSIALMVCGGAAFAGALVFAFLHADEIGRGIAGMLVALFGSVIGLAAIPNLLLRPYRFRTIDRGRGIYGLRFRSEQFTELVRQESTNTNGRSFKVHRAHKDTPWSGAAESGRVNDVAIDS